MGVYLLMDISGSLSKKEWEPVYEETLTLVNTFPLGERRKVLIHGVDTMCFARCREREHSVGWPQSHTTLMWETDGDYNTLQYGECCHLDRNMPGETVQDPDVGDAMLIELMDKKGYHVWDCKTQGGSYHLYLLAIACLVETRLGNKAFVYGDFNRRVCKEAIKLANQILTKPIDLPVSCDQYRMYRRIAQLPIDQKAKAKAFDRYYYGPRDEKYHTMLKSSFSEQDAQTFKPEETTALESCGERESWILGRKRADIGLIYDDLKFYERGDRIHPVVEKSLEDLFESRKPLYEEDKYKTLLNQSAKGKYAFLVDQNHALLLREEDWQHIYSNLETNGESFARYYPMVRINMKNDDFINMFVALAINDDLYEYCSVKFEKIQTGN